MTLNGITLEWKDPSDLPSMCCRCPFFFSGSTNAPGLSSVSQKGICNLRNMKHRRQALKIFCFIDDGTGSKVIGVF